MDLQTLVARVQAADEDPPVVCPFREVGGAAELAAARLQPPKRLPACYFLLTEDRAGRNTQVTPAVQQRISQVLSVVILNENKRDARGGLARDELTPLRNYLLDRLIGWSPAAGYDPFEKGGGKVIGFQDLVLWFKDDFLTSHLMRKVS